MQADSIDNEKILEWLVSECRDIGSRIGELVLAGERILATGTTILLAAATIAIGDDKPYVLMALPLAIAILANYLLFLNNDVMAMGGYKAALEQVIFARSGIPIIQWESRIAKNWHNRIQVICIASLGTVAYLASSVVAVAQAEATFRRHSWGHEHPDLFVAATCASIVMGLVSISFSFIAQVVGRERIERQVAGDLRLARERVEFRSRLVIP